MSRRGGDDPINRISPHDMGFAKCPYQPDFPENQNSQMGPAETKAYERLMKQINTALSSVTDEMRE